MRSIGALAMLTMLTIIGCGGAALAWTGWCQPSGSITRILRDLDRGERAGSGGETGWIDRLTRHAADRLRGEPRIMPNDVTLRLVSRTAEQHVAYLLAAFAGGFVVPGLVIVLLQWNGVVSLAWIVPLGVALCGAALAPSVIHATTIERARAARVDLRYQASAFLDVVTMLLAGNTGFEAALDQAAAAGDGRLFVELRSRMRREGARGTSLTEALRSAGAELGLEELEQIAATVTLSAAEGAPVARSLAAKCATMRAALATDQETEARLRTSRLTTPIVGMALIFMALVIYPALSVT